MVTSFWGGPLGGNCNANGTLNNQGSNGNYWTSTSQSATNAFNLYFDTNGWVDPQNNNNKDNGLTLRCVR
ncbi:MAG: hypothetical protein FWG79_08835 [Bacteroidales bacterium]|nr:hypothetical protein [Bacteroidales bacterium]